jgi:CRISPR-associated endonuclease/helicase Cas3/CRISPR-associated endonuclease Cas3-HD
MSSRDIWARPPVDGETFSLRTHLEEVSRFMTFVGSFTEQGNPSEATIARTLGLLHDFGKITPQFQSYLDDDYAGERKYTYHARIGALATFHAVRELDTPPRVQLAACLCVARHHGSTPDAVPYVFDNIYRSEDGGGPRSWVETQVEAIATDERSRQAASELFDTVPGPSTWKSFRNAFEDGQLLDALADFVSEEFGFGAKRDPTVERLPERTYDSYLRFWGALTIADKTSAAGLTLADLRTDTLELDPLLDHIDSISAEDELEATLNEWRERARKDVCANVTQLRDGPSVGRITLPTGLGKTFTGISAAFALRDTITRETDGASAPTVVYALPYTSIIEQTREHFESEDIWNADPRSKAFGVHHYLSETVTDPDSESQTDGEPETDDRQPPAALLGESWRSGTVLTTFVQLFESLAGPSNSQSLKLPALNNAVVILDEPQALPLSWWPVVRRLVETITEEFDATVLSMTATQPSLFEEGAVETTDLVSDPAAYFEQSQRVTYHIDQSVWGYTTSEPAPLVSHEAAAERIVDRLTGTDTTGRSSGLAVCNTIASCRQLVGSVETAASNIGCDVTLIGESYETALQEVSPLDDDSDSAVETLVSETLQQAGFAYDPLNDDWNPPKNASQLFVCPFNSRYRPLDRRVLIEVADELSTADVRFVMVATQAVEAGVDLSFSAVWRDLAPLDSVVQAAGRCNRSFEWGRNGGDVTVWYLADPEEPSRTTRDEIPPAKRIYNRERKGWLVDVAAILRESLSGPDAIPEIELTRSVIPAYFDRLETPDIHDLTGAVEQFEGERLGRASLIAQDYETVDVLVGVTAAERQQIREIGDHFVEGNTPAGYKLLEAASDLRVSIPVRDAEAHLNGVTRVDRQDWGEPEGPNVLAYTGEDGASHDLARGGFVVEDAGVSNQFTT